MPRVGFSPDFQQGIPVGPTPFTPGCTECARPDGHGLTRQTQRPDSTGSRDPDGHPGQISVTWGTEVLEFKSRQPDELRHTLNSALL